MPESNVQDVLNEIQAVLARRLNLQSPRFVLESSGSKVSGSIISPSFRGIRDSARQRLLWDALRAEYGSESVRRVGALLAFTPDEWDIDSDSDEVNA